jgi:acyl-CoA thioester hydrolase
MTFTAGPEHIDELGHVNNGVWVNWMEQVATAHWQADGDPAHVAAFAWVVTRHEIDYRGNVGLGESVTAETFIPAPPTDTQTVAMVRVWSADGTPADGVAIRWTLLRGTGAGGGQHNMHGRSPLNKTMREAPD